MKTTKKITKHRKTTIIKMIDDKKIDVMLVSSLGKNKETNCIELGSTYGTRKLDEKDARSMLWDYMVYPYEYLSQYKYFEDPIDESICTLCPCKETGRMTLWFISGAVARRYNERVDAYSWISNGGLVMRREGFAYRGARPYPITKEKAIELLPDYSFDSKFGNGLEWEQTPQGKALIFQSYGECDYL